jgi:hypothetical protein
MVVYEARRLGFPFFAFFFGWICESTTDANENVVDLKTVLRA